jgi:hypothetical protein
LAGSSIDARNRPGATWPMAVLNGPQSRAILCGFLDVHRRMAELEALLTPGRMPSAFSEYVTDLSPTEAQVVQDYFARIRTAMLAHLRELEIPLEIRRTSLRWALQAGISFIGTAVDELRPSKLRGYGELGPEASARCIQISEDLGRLVDQVATYLRQAEAARRGVDDPAPGSVRRVEGGEPNRGKG